MLSREMMTSNVISLPVYDLDCTLAASFRHKILRMQPAMTLNDRDVSQEIKDLTHAVSVLTEKITNLITFNQQITKWLIICICAIALGKSAIDLAQGWVNHGMTTVSTYTAAAVPSAK